MRQRAVWLAVWGMILLLAGGCAGPAMPPRGLAQYHWDAIASNDIGKTTFHYTPNSTLDWVGGPLQGKYAGSGAIAETWTKFFIAQGPMDADVTDLQERQEGSRQIVAAKVLFKGRRAVPVDYTLVFDGGRIVAETWKVAP